MSISPDPIEAWKESAADYNIGPESPLLSDANNRVATAYDVMRWQAATGEPGHTFVLVDRDGGIDWIKDYGAPENGGVMYVLPDEMIRQVKGQLSD